MFHFGEKKKIAEKLYEQNLELAIKNKTFSLLEKLYQTSVVNLTPEETGRQIVDDICKDLNLEFAGVFVFKKETDDLTPLAFSESERLRKILDERGISFQDIKIPNISHDGFFKPTIYNQTDNITNNFEEVWNGFLEPEYSAELKTVAHIKTTLLQPLIIDREVFGALIMGFNRDYNTLNTFEKASIKSFITVIALLINKAYLYKYLQDSYEVEKKAYAVEKRANEELKELDNVKNQFLMTIQHHLRTPLTSMRGYSELLLSGSFGKIPKKIEEVVKRFEVSTVNLIKMVNDFLDVTQFQLGKGMVNLKDGVDLSPVLAEIVGDEKLEASKKGIYLKLETPKEPCLIKADESKLKAAVVNVFDNCVKYTNQGGVAVTLKVENDLAKIQIKDTGMGIAKERLANLFNNTFQRGEEAKKTFVSGKGIGLYLAGKIVAAHGGKIWAESEGEGKGSTFNIELPIGKESAVVVEKPKI